MEKKLEISYEEAVKRYDRIFKVLEQEKDVLDIDLSDLYLRRDKHLFTIKVKEKLGISIPPSAMARTDYFLISRNKGSIYVGYFGGKYNRSVDNVKEWDNKKEELLMAVHFSTGAYIFGQHYPKKLFGEFFDELKTYKPKYIDKPNKILYFNNKNASKLKDDFYTIYENIKNLAKIESTDDKIVKLEAELDALKNERKMSIESEKSEL